MTNLEQLKLAIPDYAKDIRIHLENVLNIENKFLSASQIYGLTLASAYAVKNKKLMTIFENETKSDCEAWVKAIGAIGCKNCRCN